MFSDLVGPIKSITKDTLSNLSGVETVLALSNWDGLCVGRLSSHTGCGSDIYLSLLSQMGSNTQHSVSWLLCVCWNLSALELNCSS